jgi:hypothetical protein
MAPSTQGAGILPAEVGNIDRHGLWLFVGDKEYFLPHDHFPCFRDATIGQIMKVELHDDSHLCWPELNVEISLDSLANPDSCPAALKA